MARRNRNPDRLRVVGYIRVSTDDQHLGPVAQRDALERWCEAHGAVLVAVFEDLGVSGGTALDRRPGLLAAVDALSEHDAGTLLAAKRDRIARDVVIAAQVERLVARQGGHVATVDGAGDGNTPEAQLMRRLVDAFAEYERALIRARTRAALAVKRSRRERTNSTAPYGYRIADDGRRVEPDPAEQRVVATVRQLREGGETLRGIAARLNADPTAQPRGKRWHPTTVARLLGRDGAAA